MEKVLLIDGNSLVNRAYFALPPLNNPQGVQVQAVYGFATMLIKMIETVKPDCIVTAFDVHAPTFRHKLYDGYKSRRKGMPDELAAQMPVLKDMLDVMGIRRIEAEGYEADDIIGTLAKRLGGDTYIVTGDRDSFQLIDDNTRVLFTKRGITETDEVDERLLAEKYELTPQGVIEYKALAGDSSDDIPGVPGVGDKTAKSLLRKYGDTQNIYAHLEEITPPSLRERLRTGKESAALSRVLATIDTNAPIECDAEKCRYRFPFSAEVFAFFERQGFKSLLRRAEIFNTDTVLVPASQRTAATVTAVTSVEQLDDVVRGKNEIAVCFSENTFHFAVDEQNEYTVNLKIDFFSSGLSESEVVRALRSILADEKVTKVVFDSKSFITYIHKQYGFMAAGFFDVQLAQYLADGTVPHAKLSDLLESYSIAAADKASGMLTLRRRLDEELNASSMHRLYYDVEQPLVKVLFSMEQAGFAVNRARLEEIGKAFSQEEEVLTKQIHAAAGRPFNIKSPRQLAQVLFEDMGIPYPKKGAKTYNTGAEILEQLDPSYTIVPLVLRYRFITKLNSTYVDGLRKLIDAQGTVHTEFRQTLTTTGRLSSVEPPEHTRARRGRQSVAVAVCGARRVYVGVGRLFADRVAHHGALFGRSHYVQSVSRWGGHSRLHRRASVRRAARRGNARYAPRRQNGQFRHYLRHERFRVGIQPKDRQGRGQKVYRQLLRTVCGRAQIFGRLRGKGQENGICYHAVGAASQDPRIVFFGVFHAAVR